MAEVKDLNYCLALLNSKIAHIVFNILNPTINLQNKDVKRFPIIINSIKKENIENISKENVELTKKDWDFFETSWDFKKHPLI